MMHCCRCCTRYGVVVVVVVVAFLPALAQSCFLHPRVRTVPWRKLGATATPFGPQRRFQIAVPMTSLTRLGTLHRGINSPLPSTVQTCHQESSGYLMQHCKSGSRPTGAFTLAYGNRNSGNGRGNRDSRRKNNQRWRNCGRATAVPEAGDQRSLTVSGTELRRRFIH